MFNEKVSTRETVSVQLIKGVQPKEDTPEPTATLSTNKEKTDDDNSNDSRSL